MGTHRSLDQINREDIKKLKDQVKKIIKHLRGRDIWIIEEKTTRYK